MSVWNLSSASAEVCPEPRSRPPGSSLLSTGTWPTLGESLRLSPRELQVVKGVFQDHKEELIAADLGISPHTVSTYLQRIYAKLCVQSRTQLIVRVIAEYLRAARLDVARAHDR
jgi:DNA-binding NarL/FixJ family response regulator